jgi:hypothetical protein
MLSVFKRLPRAQALKLARQALREGAVTPTSHYEREREKENLTDQDVTTAASMTNRSRIPRQGTGHIESKGLY